MNRSHLLIVSLFAMTFVIVAAAYRTAPAATATPSFGTIFPAASMLEPRSGHSATLLPDGHVLIAGGMRRNQDFYKSAELYDPATGKFQPTGEMNQRRVGQVQRNLADDESARTTERHFARRW